ncbi:MAG: hypothetical protein ACOVSW_21840 [Candidatus Kapaibacteriota bacterium]
MRRVYAKLFALVSFFGVLMMTNASPISAQEWTSGNRLMIHLGGGLPVGSFGQSYNVAADLEAAVAQIRNGNIPTGTPAERTEIGNATLGFNAGLTDLFKLTPNFSLIGTLEVSYNPFNASDYTNQYNGLFRDPAFLQRLGLNPSSSSINVALDVNAVIPPRAYLNTALLLGGRYDIPLSGSLSLFASAQAGILYGIYPEFITNLTIKQTVSGTSFGIPLSTEQRSEQNSKISTMGALAFAYKLGVGVLLNNRINIGIGYFGGQPQYGPANITTETKAGGSITVGGMTTALPSASNTATREISTRTNLPVGILQLSVGYLIGD